MLSGLDKMSFCIFEFEQGPQLASGATKSPNHTETLHTKLSEMNKLHTRSIEGIWIILSLSDCMNNAQYGN